jgi:hypothetical protein
MWWAPPEDKPGILFPPNGFIYIFLPRCLPVSLSPRPRRTENGKKRRQGKAALVLRPGAFPCWRASDMRGLALLSLPCCFLPAGGAGRGQVRSVVGKACGAGGGAVVGPHATHVSTGSCRRPGGSQAGSSADRRLAGTLCGWSVRAGG